MDARPSALGPLGGQDQGYSVLTPHVPEVDGLSVWVQQLDDGVVVVLHSTADDGRVALHHRHVLRHQVLAHH